MSLLAPETIDVETLPAVAFTARYQLPNSAALYFVLDGKSHILYVGRAKSLCFRWATHHLNHQLSLLPDIRIAYLAVVDSVQLVLFERACIKRFVPPMNRSRKGQRKDLELITLRFPKDILEHFRSVAAREDRSLNEQLLHTLKAHVGAEKKGTKTASA